MGEICSSMRECQGVHVEGQDGDCFQVESPRNIETPESLANLAATISVLRLLDYKKRLLECLLCFLSPELENVSNPSVRYSK